MKIFQKSTLYSLISVSLAASFSFSLAAAPYYDANYWEAPRASADEQDSNIGAPVAEFWFPMDNEVIGYGEPLRVNFRTPPKVSATSLMLDGMELLNEPVGPEQDFYQIFFYHTYTSGPQRLILTLETESGQQYKQEKNYQVVTYSRFFIESPEQNQTFSSGDTVPIRFKPSGLEEVTQYRIRVNGKDVTTITKPPLEYNYKLTDPNSEMRITVASLDKNGDTVEEDSVYIRVNLFKNGLTILPAIKEGSAAIEVGEVATLVADIRNDQTDKPLTAEEAAQQIEEVNFYINYEKVGSDSTPPYEYEWLNRSSVDYYAYSDTYKFEIGVRSKDVNYGGESSKEKDLQVMPELGRNYCNTRAPQWNSEKQYKRNDLVRYNGFFYKAIVNSKNAPPAEQSYEGLWHTQNCDSDILIDSEIKIEVEQPKPAKLGEIVTVKGKLDIPKEITLDKLLVIENRGSPSEAREVKVNADGSFTLAHRFRGEGQCFNARCDTFDFKATNNLGYKSVAFASIYEGIAPTISGIYTEERFGRTYLRVNAKDNGDQLRVEVFNGDNKVGQGIMRVVHSYHEHGGRVFLQTASLLLSLEPGNYDITVVVTDKDGTKVSKPASVQIPKPYPVIDDWNY